MKFFKISLRAQIFCLPFLTILGGGFSSAQASENFGDQGQVMIGGSSNVEGLWKYKRGVYKNRTSITLAPTIGWFVAKDFLLSTSVGWESELSRLRGPIVLSVSQKIGHNINFGHGVSLLPAVGGTYMFGFGNGTPSKLHVAEAFVEAPFYFQVVRHGAIHLGPTATHRFTQGGSQSVGVTGGIAIWL